MNQVGSSSGSWSASTNQSLSSSSSNSTSSSSPSMNSILFHPKSDSSNSIPNSTPSLQQDDEDEEEGELNSSSPGSHSQSVWTKTRSNTRFNSSNGSNSDDEDDDYHIHSGTTPTLSRSSKDHSISSPSETATSNSSNPIDFDPMDLSPAQPFLPHHERGNRDRPNLENTLKASKNLQPITGLDLGSDDALMELDGNGGVVGVGQDGVRIVGSLPHQQAEIQHTGLPSSSNPQPFSTPAAFSSSRHGGDLERRFATHVSMTPPASFGSQTSNQSPFTLALNNNNINSGSSRKIGGNVGGSSNLNTPNLAPSFRSISHNHTHSIPRSHAFNSLAFLPQEQVTISSSNLAPSASPLDPNETPIKSKVLKTRSSSTAANPNPQFSPQKRVHSHHHGRSQSQGGSALNVGGMRRTFPLNQSLRKGNLVNNHNGHLTSSSASEDEDEEHHLAEKSFNSSGKGKGRNLAGRIFGGSDPMSGGTGLGLDLGEDQEEERDWKPSSQPINSNSSRTRAQTEGSNINNSNISAVASRRGRAPAMLKVSSSSGSSCASFSGGSIGQTQFLPKKDEEMDLDEPVNPSSASDEEGEENSHPASPTPVVWDVAFPTSSSPSKSKIEDERMHELQPGPQQPVLRKNPKGRHSRTASSNGVGNESNRRSQLLDQSPPSFNIQAATPKSPSAPEFRGLGLCLGPSPSSSTSRTSKHSTMEQPTGPYQSKSLSAATGNSRSSPFKTPYKRRTSSNASERPRNRALSSASASNSSNGLLDFNIPRSNSASSATLDLDEKLKGSATLFGFASPNRNASLSSASKSHNDLNVNNRINLLSYSAPRPTTKNQSQAELNLRNGTNSVGRLFSRDSLQISNEASISTPIKSNDNKKSLIHSSLISSIKNGKEFDDSGIAFGGDSPSVEAALRNGNSKGLDFDPRKELLFQTERRLASRLGVSEDPNESLSSSSNNSIRQRSSIGDFSSPAKVRPSTLNSNFNSPNSFTSSTPLKTNGLIPNLQRQPRERSSLANETKLSNSNSNGSSLGDESEEEEGGLSGYGRPTVNRLRSGSGSNLLSIGRPSDLNSLEMARKVSTGSIGLGGGFAQSVKSSSTSSTNSGFSTPQNYKNVKPLQTAFMSTGLVSKRARMNTNDGAGNCGNGTNGGEGNSNEVPIPRPNFASALGLREVVAAAAQVQSSTTANGAGNGVGPMPDTPVKKPVSMMMPGGGGISKSLRTHQGDSSFNHASEPSPSSFTSSSNTSSGGNGVESPQIPDSCDSPTLNLLSVNGGFPELGSSNESSSSFSSSVGNGIGSSSMSRTNSNNVTSGNRLLNRVSKGSPNELNQFQSPAKSLPRPRHHLQRQDAFIDNHSTDSDPTSPASPSIGTFSNSLLRSPSNRNSNDDQIENQVLRKGRNQNPIGSTRLSPPVNQSLKSGSINSNTNASKINSPLNSNSNQSKPLSNSTNSSAKSSASSTSFGKSKNQRDGSSHAPKVRLNHNSVSPRPLKVFGSRPPLGLARKSSFGVSSEQAIQMAMDGNSMNMAGSGPFASPQLGSDGVPMTPTRNGATLKWFEAAQIVTTPSPSHRKSNGSLPRSHRTRQLAQELSGSSTPAKSKALGSIVVPKPQSTSKFQSQFIVQSVLGQGEFSEAVKVADKTQDGAVFAIKRMKRPFVGQKDRVRHLEEVDILRHLSSEGGHPNVISLVDAWEELGHLFIQTELCPLGTLSFFLEVYCGQVGNLDEPRLWKILTELSDGIHFIHGKGVLHLDLKPANIFITEIGTLKIGDFGMATRWPLRDPEDILDGAGIVASDPRSAPKSTSLASASVPAAGVRRGRRSNMRITDREGDREYLAPEILEGKYSKAADMFCLGLIMLEAAGSVVLPDNGESWQKLRHDDFSEVDLSELSQPFISVVYRLLSSQAHQRPTIQELVAYPVLNAVRKRMARGLLHSELDQLPDFEINSKDNKVGDCSFGNISLGKIFESEQANEKDQDGDETMNDGEDEADRTNDSILGLSGVQRDQRVVVDVRGALIQETDEDFLTEVLSSINQIGNEDENSTAAFLACSSPRNQTFSNSSMDQNSTLRISPSQSHSNHTQSLSESNVDSYPTRSTSSPANMSPEDPNAMDLDGDEDEEEEDEAEFFGSHQTIYNHQHGQAGSVP